MKFVIGGALAMLIASALVLFFLSSQERRFSPEQTLITETPLNPALSAPVIPESKKDEVVSASDSELVDGVLIKPIPAPQSYPAFYKVSANSQFVSLNYTYLAKLEAGNSLDITLPQSGITYNVYLDSREVDSLGSTVWKGKITNYDQLYQVAMTQNHEYTFISMTTPEGSFAIDGQGELALVRPLSDYGHPNDVSDAAIVNASEHDKTIQK
jgi:hypothetical protein